VSEVTDLIGAYRGGELSLDELAHRFRVRNWPSRRPGPGMAREGWQRELEDPEPILEGSFGEVVSAYHLGQLSGDEYEVLSRAVSEAGTQGKS
jgi:hypothetical protein